MLGQRFHVHVTRAKLKRIICAHFGVAETLMTCL